MTNKTAATPLPLPSGDDLQAQTTTLVRESWAWVGAHWLEILIAAGVAAAVVVLLHMVRRWAMKLCQRGEGAGNWYSIIGRAIARTGNFFIVMIALRLVSGYARTPQVIDSTVEFLFTIAMVFQAAIWVREVIFGLVEHRTMSENYHGQALSSAIGLIRLLVSIAVFAIALVVVLSNLGVNVTGLVAGLGLAVRYLAGGRTELNGAAPVDAGLVLGAGLFVAVGTGVAAMLLGGEFLQSATLDFHLPLLGHVHFVTSVFFDVGVFLIVVGLVLDILRSLGAEMDRQEEVNEQETGPAGVREEELV